MAKPIDISSLSLDELNELVTAANGRIGELKQAKIEELRAKRAELDAELEKLGDVSKPGKPRLPPALPGGEPRKRSPKKLDWQGPSGRKYATSGVIPKEFTDMGITTREGMEPYRIKE